MPEIHLSRNDGAAASLTPNRYFLAMKQECALTLCTIKLDYGPEHISGIALIWAAQRSITIKCIQLRQFNLSLTSSPTIEPSE